MKINKNQTFFLNDNKKDGWYWGVSLFEAVIVDWRRY